MSFGTVIFIALNISSLGGFIFGFLGRQKQQGLTAMFAAMRSRLLVVRGVMLRLGVVLRLARLFHFLKHPLPILLLVFARLFRKPLQYAVVHFPLPFDQLDTL